MGMDSLAWSWTYRRGDLFPILHLPLRTSTSSPASETSFVNVFYTQTGSLARIESIITSLIFDHALRIRLKAEPAQKKSGEASSGVATPEAQGAHTPDNASEGGDEDDATTITAGTSTTAVASASQPADQSKDDKKADAKEAKESEETKASNLMGKLNNLVTSDLENITDGRDFLFTGECFPVHSRTSY